MTTEQPVRVAVIGAGAIATRGHIPSLQKLPGVTVVAICDTNAERARTTADELNIPDSYSDWKDVIARDDIDAVTIGVPNVFHAPISLAAIKSGKHVLCEKPLAMNATEGAEVVNAAQEAGKVLAVNLNNRLRPDIQALKRSADNGRFGKIYYISARMIRRSGIPGFGSWFTRKELSGGGALLDIGVHSLDMALYISSFPTIAGVQGIIASMHGPQGRGQGGWGIDRVAGGTFDVDDFASVSLRLADGGTIKVEVTWAAHGPNEERLQIFGDKGGADLDADRYGAKTPVRYFTTEDGEELDITPAIAPNTIMTWQLSIGRFIEAIRGNGQPAATGAEALQVQRILDAVYRSAAEGREVTL